MHEPKRWMIVDGPNGFTLAVDLASRAAAEVRLEELLVGGHPDARIVRQRTQLPMP